MSTLVPTRLARYVCTILAAVVAVPALGLLGDPADATRNHPNVKKALQVARAQKGEPYRYGANGPNAFDCSGLTQYAYKKAGVQLPRTSGGQASWARRLENRNNIRAGDFMFFADGGGVYHMGLFTGRWQNGRRMILHASRSGTPVKVDPVWTSNWFAGTIRHR